MGKGLGERIESAPFNPIAYKMKEDLVVDGEGIQLEAFDSSVWVRRDGKWVCVVHTESLAGDPFGRH